VLAVDADTLGRRWYGRTRFKPSDLGILAIASCHAKSAQNLFACAFMTAA
jgi:hypothetical protein